MSTTYNASVTLTGIEHLYSCNLPLWYIGCGRTHLILRSQCHCREGDTCSLDEQRLFLSRSFPQMEIPRE